MAAKNVSAAKPKAKAKSARPAKCLTCSNKSQSRGLCARCLRHARMLIEKDETSEAKLIEGGFMLPAMKRGPKAESGLAKALARKA